MDLKPLFEPQTMAVFGVSSNNHRHPANEIFTKNLLRYPVKVYGINPRGGTVNGQSIHQSISEIPEPIDLAVSIGNKALLGELDLLDYLARDPATRVIAFYIEGFGPMILLGMGGTGVEIYQDISLRMAPLTEKNALAMIEGLKAHQLLEGYRGAAPVDRGRLTETIRAFSSLVMELEGRTESIDINPLLCSADRCVVADARIILRR